MNPSALPDESVVALVRRGERDRFEILMRRYNQRVYRAVRGILADDAEVEDVMQQAYFRAFLKLDQLADGARVSGWLLRIAINEAFERLRRRRGMREEELGQEDGDEMSAPRNPELDMEERELAGLLEAALGDLRDIYRVVFVLREVEGLATDEVAEALGVSPQVVKTRLHRARELLREGLLVRAGRAAADVFTFRAPRCDRVVAGVLERIRNQS
jgi:RNA polymerase sigma-70 factor (ECF subfamily)